MKAKLVKDWIKGIADDEEVAIIFFDLEEMRDEVESDDFELLTVEKWNDVVEDWTEDDQLNQVASELICKLVANATQ